MKNKFTKKLLVPFIAILTIVILLVIYFSFPTSKSPLPDKYVGNWINEKDNNWEFGFFEEFVIYDCDFWDYHSVNFDNENQVEITLKKGNEKMELQLVSINPNQIKIISETGEENFILMGGKFPNYSTKDTEFFSTPTFQGDSATIIGYYRNLDKGLKGFAQRFFPSPFQISFSDFLSRDEVKYYADIDKLGRFKLTFPIMNPQELFVDWKRTRLKAVMEPNDVLFLFVDINDYLPTSDDKEKSYENYVDRSKQILFMGNNARLNNEIYQYKDPWISINKSEWKQLSDMDFLKNCENVYKQRIELLNEYIEKNPNISDKFRYYKQEQEKYEFAFHLMQHRFDLRNKENRSFQDGYIQYIEDFFSFDDELLYTLTRDFGIFLRDYIGYISDLKERPHSVEYSELKECLRKDGELTNDIERQINEIYDLVGKIETETKEKKQPLIDELISRGKELNMNKSVKNIADSIFQERSFFNTDIADSLIANPNLRELWTTNLYQYWFEVLRKPLSIHQQKIFKQKVTNPFLRSYIDKIQKHYGDVANIGFSYEASLKNTEHLKEYREADELFTKLIEPYKGKVIYVDFWGTWCAPCRENMRYVNSIKERLQSEDVVFMYFANRSPEDTWRNVIKEFDLTGENIVHYRLPDVQQGMIERKLSVTSFPTYMLIDRNGKVVNTNAEQPRNPDGVMRQIKELQK